MLEMPSLSATAHACCGPAPPKAIRVWSVGSKPSWIEILRIASAIRSVAISRRPARSAASLMAGVICALSSSNRRRLALSSRGIVMWSVSMCPRSRLTSVSVSGPPFRVAGRSRISASALGADAETARFQATNRATSGRDSFDLKRRRQQVGVADPLLELVSWLPAGPRDVGARPAHIETR